ncbi:iron(III) transport system ATP-binding protein/putative spermidine/putrescine transport system ATP-binding protein [Sinobaca qinghaiensis]|uniref:Carnitine transport ATP-binding protein OpuCA n=1 Tax=Sinobaca qinghaiensis TaxID=342944 RepID=A0A419V412_9BACL|nr:ABC transporter ATP-binding protein [Sinobaca qinghaiensis]RKD73233.1 iron(III) transport system ATP-binding protein/putative spermidine/putrescine transport system ATP-binding protein [Sinobaca qinghaiensis]
MAYLEIQSLTKQYKNEIVLNKVDIKLERGETMSILGRSGTGKTTLLRTIAGIVKEDDGDIFINGENVKEKPAEDRPVVMMFQKPLLFPHMNAADNTAYGLKVKKVPSGKRRQEAEKFLEKVGLAGFGDKFPAECSGGEQQRISLARALIVKPKLLLMDEPFSHLDSELRRSMRLWVKEVLKEEGVTALFVTHDREEAEQMGDKLAVLGDGEILQSGLAEELYRRPAHPIVASLASEGFFTKEGAFVPLAAMSTKETTQPSRAFRAVIMEERQAYGLRFYNYYLKEEEVVIALQDESGTAVPGNETVLYAPASSLLFSEHTGLLRAEGEKK